MPDLFEISGLLWQGMGEPMGNGFLGEGAREWWGAMAVKAEDALRRGEIPYSRQAEVERLSKQFRSRAREDAPMPAPWEARQWEATFPRGPESLLGFLSAAAVKKGLAGMTAEKKLAVAENQLVKGNKQMAYLWAIQALNLAKKEKKPLVAKRAQEIIDAYKKEKAAKMPPAVAALFDAEMGSFGRDPLHSILAMGLHDVGQKLDRARAAWDAKEFGKSTNLWHQAYGAMKTVLVHLHGARQKGSEYPDLIPGIKIQLLRLLTFSKEG